MLPSNFRDELRNIYFEGKIVLHSGGSGLRYPFSIGCKHGANFLNHGFWVGFTPSAVAFVVSTAVSALDTEPTSDMTSVALVARYDSIREASLRVSIFVVVACVLWVKGSGPNGAT